MNRRFVTLFDTALDIPESSKIGQPDDDGASANDDLVKKNFQKPVFCLGGLLIVFLSGVFVGACSRIEHLSSQAFLKQAKQIENMNSATQTVYLGRSQERVYLETWSAYRFLKPKRIVYWTFLSDLPDEIAAKIRKGKNPWTPWEDQTEGNRREHTE